MSQDLSIPEPFAWSTRFDVKSATFNAQHVKLFSLIAALEKDMQNAALLNELLDYVKMHFKTEEDDFAHIHYDGADGHKAIHDKFLSDCSAVTAINADVIAFLKKWLVEHILVSDIKYASLY